MGEFEFGVLLTDREMIGSATGIVDATTILFCLSVPLSPVGLYILY